MFGIWVEHKQSKKGSWAQYMGELCLFHEPHERPSFKEDVNFSYEILAYDPNKICTCGCSGVGGHIHHDDHSAKHAESIRENHQNFHDWKLGQKAHEERLKAESGTEIVIDEQ